MRKRHALLNPLCTGAAAAIVALAIAACTSVPVGEFHDYHYGDPIAPGSVLRAEKLSPDLEARILALDPAHVSDADVRQTLARGPTPRIFALHGGIYPVHLVMESFTNFLVKMGYPERAIRDPGTGSLTHSPYEEGAELAGEVAWYYEHEGVRPMLVGHSQGGTQIVKILYELAGQMDDDVPVFNPLAGKVENRTTIVDPLSGESLGLKTLKVPYASAVAAGGLALVMPNQWSMVNRAYEIPDSVIDFTAFSIGVDLIALDNGKTRDRYRATGTAHVRNVRLPAAYSHYYAVDAEPLANDAATRAWLNAWTPALVGKDPPGGLVQVNAQWAADVWYSIKEHWVIEAQRFVRARQALAAH